MMALSTIALMVVTSSAPAYLCTRASGDGPSLAWTPREILVQPSGSSDDIDDDDVVRVLNGAADQWSQAGDCTDIVVVIGASTSDRLAGFDWAAGSGSPENHNIVVFRTGNVDDDPADAWLHSSGALAITTVTYDAGSGRLLDADVEVNDVTFDFTACDPADCTVDFDLENTLVHELGHVLGLDHSDSVNATMFASAPRGDLSKRDLDDDDVDGICFVYPVDAAARECFDVERVAPPDVRFSPTVCGASGTAAPVLWALLVLVFVRLTRMRRR